jgi:hypothetical protein
VLIPALGNREKRVPQGHSSPTMCLMIILVTQVCSTFWWKALGISKGRYVQIRKRVTGNATDNLVKNRRAKPNGPASNFAQFYLKRHFVQNGQHVPNKPGTIHLSHGTHKNTVYEEFCAFHAQHVELQLDPPETQTYEDFLRLWRTTFPSVKCLKSTDFALCSDCSFFREQLHFGDISGALQVKLDYVYKEHLRNQRDARLLFYDHNIKAKENSKYVYNLKRIFLLIWHYHAMKHYVV